MLCKGPETLLYLNMVASPSLSLSGDLRYLQKIMNGNVGSEVERDCNMRGRETSRNLTQPYDEVVIKTIAMERRQF